MATASDFLPLVMVEAVGASPLLAETYIMRACAEFCERSLVWSVDHAPIALVSNQTDYPLTVPTDAKFAQVRTAKLGGATMKPVKDYGVNSFVAPPVLSLKFTPTNVPAGVTIDLNVAWQPTLTAATVPDVLLREHLHAIADGAKSLLLSIMGQTWSNPVRAVQCRAGFEQAIATARVNVEMEGAAGDMQVRPRAFGSTN